MLLIDKDIHENVDNKRVSCFKDGVNDKTSAIIIDKSEEASCNAQNQDTQ